MSKIVLFGSEVPIDQSIPGTAWTAVTGEPAYRRVHWISDDDKVDHGDGVSAWVGEQIDSEPEQGNRADATALLIVGHQVSETGDADEFDLWWNTDHIPALSRVPGTLSAHRYRSSSGQEPEYFAVYHLRDPEVRTSDNWKEAAATELGARAREHWGMRVIGFYHLDGDQESPSSSQ